MRIHLSLEQHTLPRNNLIVSCNHLPGPIRNGYYQFIVFEQKFNYTTSTRPILGEQVVAPFPSVTKPSWTCAAACHLVPGRIGWNVCTYHHTMNVCAWVHTSVLTGLQWTPPLSSSVVWHSPDTFWSPYRRPTPGGVHAVSQWALSQALSNSSWCLFRGISARGRLLHLACCNWYGARFTSVFKHWHATSAHIPLFVHCTATSNPPTHTLVGAKKHLWYTRM